MKKIIALILMPFIFKGQITGVSQSEQPTEVKIGFYKRSDFDISHMVYLISKGDTTVVWDYYNQKYSTLKDRKYIYFNGGAKAVNDLYQLLLSFYSDANKDNEKLEIKFTLGKTEVTTSRSKKQIFVWTKDGYFSLDKGNINSLFTNKR